MLNKYHRTCNTVIKNAQIFNSSCSLEKCIYHLYIAPTRQEFLHILSHVRIEFTPVQRIHSTPSPPKFCFFICSHSHPINKMTLFTIFHYPGRQQSAKLNDCQFHLLLVPGRNTNQNTKEGELAISFCYINMLQQFKNHAL